MFKPTYGRLWDAIEMVIFTSKRFPNKYYFRNRDTNKYLVELGALGSKDRIQLPTQYRPGCGPQTKQKYAWLINRKRLEEVQDKLRGIAKEQGFSEGQYTDRFGLMNNAKLQSLRIDLEKLK